MTSFTNRGNKQHIKNTQWTPYRKNDTRNQKK